MPGRSSQVYQLGPGGVLQPSLGFWARSVRIDNAGGQWPLVAATAAAVPVAPFIISYVASFPATQSPLIVDSPLPGNTSQGGGLPASIQFYEAEQAPVPGIAIQPFGSGSGTVGLTPSAVGSGAGAGLGLVGHFDALLGNGVPVGDGLIVVAAILTTNAGDSIASITDPTHGNAIGLRVQSGLFGAAGNLGAVAIGACINVTTQFNVGDPIRVTDAVGTIVAAALAMFRIVGGLNAFDQSASAVQGAVTALTVGPTGVTATRNELAIAGFGADLGAAGAIPAFTAGSGYTAANSASAVGGGGNHSIAVWPEFFLTSITGNQTATGTLGSAQVAGGGALASFR